MSLLSDFNSFSSKLVFHICATKVCFKKKSYYTTEFSTNFIVTRVSARDNMVFKRLDLNLIPVLA